MASATSTTVRESIVAVANQRAALLSTLQQAQEAAAQLVPARAELKVLRDRMYILDTDLNHKTNVAEKHKWDLDQLDKSNFRALFASSKLKKTRLAKEDELIAALMLKEAAAAAHELVKPSLEEKQKQVDKLTKVAVQRVHALNALDALYSSVFDGPTSSLDGEDDLEKTMTTARDIYEEVQGRMSTAATVFNNVCLAQKSLGSAGHSAGLALSESSADISGRYATSRLLGGPVNFNASALADQRERRALQWTQRHILEAEHYLAIAHSLDPEVSGFDRVQVADGHGTLGRLDQYLDTPMTDYLFHREIAKTSMSIQEARLIADYEVEQANARMGVIQKERDPAKKAYEEARDKLLRFRESAFEGALKGTQGRQG